MTVQTETWTLPKNDAPQHIWLAELYGWKIVSQTSTENDQKVIIVAERVLGKKQ